MKSIWAKQALTSHGWQDDVLIVVNESGRIETVDAGSPSQGFRVDIALPAPGNLHSHGFQRALAGLTETHSQAGADSFWTWRKHMYEFIHLLTPEEIETITAFAQMEMLESGFAAVAEFHYVHHQAGGQPYDDIAELCARIIAAAELSGIGLTLLPVFYQYGGFAKVNPLVSQRRFVNTMDRYLKLFEGATRKLGSLPPDCKIGMAAHSLRAVDPPDLVSLNNTCQDLPFHVHVAEQVVEVNEFESCYGVRPVEWLLRHANINENWCLVHATHMTEAETRELAQTGAVAGLCPITESNLGDGIFNGAQYREANGHYGFGTDSNIRISLCEELRTLEYTQRLKQRKRAVMSRSDQSTGRALYDGSLVGGRLALARPGGAIEAGNLADILALDSNSERLAYCRGDEILDAFVFTGDNSLVSQLWSAGRHVVRDGRHIKRDEIQNNYLAVKKNILRRLTI